MAKKNDSEQPATEKDSAGSRPMAQQFTFGYLIHDVSRVRRTVMDIIMRPYGITRSQWSMLSALSRGGNDGMMQVDLARLMEVGKVTVGGLVDRLESAGLVERRADTADRRAKRVFITEAGFEVIRLMIALARDINNRIMDGSTDREVEMCEQVLGRVKKNLKDLLVEQSAGQGEDIGVGLDDMTGL